MKIAYFEATSGLAGDMIIAALLDLGIPLNYLEKELTKLPISGYKLQLTEVKRNEIVCKKFDVIVKKDKKERKFSDIIKVINESKLDTKVKELSIKIYDQIAKSETKLHNKKINEIHFHELASVDTIIDIVSSAILINKLNLDKIYCSYINVGKGIINISHGRLPVPAPVTAEILKGVPIYSTDTTFELTTPTGAAIIKTIIDKFQDELPKMRIEKIGYGAGHNQDLNLPNFLRVFIGEELSNEGITDEVIVVNTNIDDMSPQLFDYLMEKLFKVGALDVYTQPCYMKKNRPAILLEVLCYKERLNEIINTIFNETTTFGVRFYKADRFKLKPVIKEIATKFGKVKVKIGKWDNKIKTIMPEYESCKELATNKNVTIKNIYEEVTKKIRDLKNYD